MDVRAESASVRDKLSAAVASSQWDAVVVLGVENVQYWSGAWMPYAKGYLDRPSCVVWPRDGKPTLISGDELLGGIKPLSFLERFVGYQEEGALPPDVIVETVAEVLREDGLAESNIGLEMLRTSVLFFDRLSELLPRARFDPADALLRRLRMIKTPGEIEIMREGALLTDRGVWQALQSTRAGQSEHDLATTIKQEVLANGPTIEAALLVGTGEGARVLASPTNRQLELGDIVRIDLNAVHNGYYIDMGRMAVVGEASPQQKRAYRDHIAFKNSIFEYMIPGRTCAEVHAFYLRRAEEMNLELFIYPYIGLGHGIGVNGDEYPKLNQADETILEPGMVLMVEPDTLGPKGEVFHVEDMVLVTAQGVELMTWSRDWSELPVIQVET